MWETLYLLNIGSLCGDEAEINEIKEKMEALPDQERLLKYRQKKNHRAAMQSLGGSALLQLALMEYEKYLAGEREAERDTARVVMTSEAVMTPENLLARLEGHVPCEMTYQIGENGKPYFKEYPLFFSISHSGDMVLCAVSEAEIGADIQEESTKDPDKLSQRFFAESEKKAVTECEDSEQKKELFHRLWARKEAFGKMTGDGVAPVLGLDFLGEKLQGQSVSWYESSLCEEGKKYHLAICRRKQRQETADIGMKKEKR